MQARQGKTCSGARWGAAQDKGFLVTSTSAKTLGRSPWPPEEDTGGGIQALIQRLWVEGVGRAVDPSPPHLRENSGRSGDLLDRGNTPGI